jgi:hypothetical protein
MVVALIPDLHAFLPIYGAFLQTQKRHTIGLVDHRVQTFRHPCVDAVIRHPGFGVEIVFRLDLHAINLSVAH